jgi:hypothetical protein
MPSIDRRCLIAPLTDLALIRQQVACRIQLQDFPEN